MSLQQLQALIDVKNKEATFAELFRKTLDDKLLELDMKYQSEKKTLENLNGMTKKTFSEWVRQNVGFKDTKYEISWESGHGKKPTLCETPRLKEAKDGVVHPDELKRYVPIKISKNDSNKKIVLEMEENSLHALRRDGLTHTKLSIEQFRKHNVQLAIFIYFFSQKLLLWALRKFATPETKAEVEKQVKTEWEGIFHKTMIGCARSYNFNRKEREELVNKNILQERESIDATYTAQFVDWLWTDEEFEEVLNTTYMDFEFVHARNGHYYLKEKVPTSEEAEADFEQNFDILLQLSKREEYIEEPLSYQQIVFFFDLMKKSRAQREREEATKEEQKDEGASGEEPAKENPEEIILEPVNSEIPDSESKAETTEN